MGESENPLNHRARSAKSWGSLLSRELRGADVGARVERAQELARELRESRDDRLSGPNPMSVAALSGSVEMIAPLAALGIDPRWEGALPDEGDDLEAPEQALDLPLFLALRMSPEEGLFEMVAALAKAGALKEIASLAPRLEICLARRGAWEALEALKAAGLDIGGVDRSGRTLIHRLVMEESTAREEDRLANMGEVIKRLAVLGADPLRRDHAGATALERALQGGLASPVEQLLALGAEPNNIECFGLYPLKLALSWFANEDRERVVGALLRAGADPELKDAEGQSAMDWGRARLKSSMWADAGGLGESLDMMRAWVEARGLGEAVKKSVSATVSGVKKGL